MTSSARRNPLRELAQLVRAPEPGTNNLGAFVAMHAVELAPVLGVPSHELESTRAVVDELTAPSLAKLLERARGRLDAQDRERRRNRSFAAAERLGAAARWTDLGAELETDLLLGELLADRTKKWVRFQEPSGFAVTTRRDLLAAAVPLRRIHLDLASWVDAQGLHFRWRGGRGGYNWRPRDVHPSSAAAILTIPLAPHRQAIPTESRRGGAWLGHILRELGHVT
jgi:hypothetical protein